MTLKKKLVTLSRVCVILRRTTDTYEIEITWCHAKPMALFATLVGQTFKAKTCPFRRYLERKSVAVHNIRAFQKKNSFQFQYPLIH